MRLLSPCGPPSSSTREHTCEGTPVASSDPTDPRTARIARIARTARVARIARVARTAGILDMLVTIQPLQLMLNLYIALLAG